jgi:hypothetical protein
MYIAHPDYMIPLNKIAMIVRYTYPYHDRCETEIWGYILVSELLIEWVGSLSHGLCYRLCSLQSLLTETLGSVGSKFS